MQKTMTATKTLTSIGLVTLAIGGTAFGLTMLMNDKQASVTNDQIVNQSESVQSIPNPLVATSTAPICAPGCVPGCVASPNPQEPGSSKCSVVSPLPSPLPAAGSEYDYPVGVYTFGRYFNKGNRTGDLSVVNMMAYQGGTFDLKKNGEVWYANGIPSQFGYLKPDGKGGHTMHDLKGKAYGTMVLYKMPMTHIGSKFNERALMKIARYIPMGESDSTKQYNDPYPEYGQFYGPLGLVRVGANGSVWDDYKEIYKAKRNPGSEGGFAIYDLSGKLVAILNADFSRDNLLTYTVIKNFEFTEEYCLKYL